MGKQGITVPYLSYQQLHPGGVTQAQWDESP